MNPNDNTLLGIEVLEGLDAAARTGVARRCSARCCVAHEQIISQRDESDDVFFVVSGRVRATVYSRDGREVIFQDLGAGEMFGEMAAIDAMPRSTSVIALEPTLLVWLTRTVFRSLLREHPSIAEATLRRLSRLVREHTERIFEFSTLLVINRIHAEVLRLARRATANDNVAVIAAAPTHQEIADRVSARREAVSRELKAMERAGVVRWTRSEHVVCDVARLTAMVERRH